MILDVEENYQEAFDSAERFLQIIENERPTHLLKNQKVIGLGRKGIKEWINSAVLTLLVYLLMRLERWDEAEQFNEESLTLDPAYATALLNKGEMISRKGEEELKKFLETKVSSIKDIKSKGRVPFLARSNFSVILLGKPG